MKNYGLVGEKLSHSLSPMIHRKIFKYAELDGMYTLYEVDKERLEHIDEAIKTFNINGLNVTIPYKESIIKKLDEVSEEAKAIGAINTIKNSRGTLKGYNTDYYGFGKMLRRFSVDVEGRRVVVLGNGGAAKAVIQFLLDNEVSEIIIVSRNATNYRTIDKSISVIEYKEGEKIKGDILINTTPVGMYPNIGESPLSKEILKGFEVIIDLIYNPRKTKLLVYGESLNKKVIDGLYMLVAQAVKAEEIWNDVIIEEDIEEKIYKSIEMEFNT